MAFGSDEAYEGYTISWIIREAWEVEILRPDGTLFHSETYVHPSEPHLLQQLRDMVAREVLDNEAAESESEGEAHPDEESEARNE